MNYLKYYPTDVVNGDGVRCTLFVSGCIHACRGCYQKKSWKVDAGFKFDDAMVQQIINDLADTKIVRRGLTLTGGDPLHDANLDEILRLCKIVKSEFPDKNIFMWTGYLYEELEGKRREIVDLVDVLIDGKFEQDNTAPNLRYRGSRNQRVIDVQATLKSDKMVLHYED